MVSWDYTCKVCGGPAEYPRKLYCNKCRKGIPDKKTISELRASGEEEEELLTRFDGYVKSYYNRTPEGKERSSQGTRRYHEKLRERKMMDPYWIDYYKNKPKKDLERLKAWKFRAFLSRPIKRCENCGRMHKLPGRYCCIGCANAKRIWKETSLGLLRYHGRRNWPNSLGMWRWRPRFTPGPKIKIRPLYIPKTEDFEIKIPTIMDRNDIRDNFEGWDIGEDW